MSDEVAVPDRLKNAPEAQWEDIEWRVDSSPYERDGKWSARFVPYLKAHSVARLLDEWVGAEAWSDEYHQTPAGRGLECHLTILGVTKIDVGVAPSGSDDNLVVKGVYSDAFKRVASIKWGIGRNVYQLEGVWAPVKVIDKDGKKQARETDESFEVLKRVFDQRPM
jgi:hypothetical protein